MGLATAQKLSEHGMNLILIHRDRRAALDKIHRAYEEISEKVEVHSYNQDALNEAKRKEILDDLRQKMGGEKIHLLLHSIAKGNLKKISHDENTDASPQNTIEEKFAEIQAIEKDVTYGDATLSVQDFALTTEAMATSMLSWAQDMRNRNMFSQKARIVGLTSEGHHKVWPGYGAVAVAKSALETLTKYMAVELGSGGLRTNVIQAGITPTPSMEMIPGSSLMKASAKYRNPLGRTTQPTDVANVVYLLCKAEADWINGTTIIVDGGEHLV